MNPLDLSIEDATAWAERDPAGYHAAVRQAAAEMVDREIARRETRADVWVRRIGIGVSVLLAVWALTGILWVVWTVVR